MLSKYKILKIKLFRITFRCSPMDDVKASKCYVSDMCMQCKVGKESKFWNRYNQVPHLTQDPYGKVTNTLNIRYRRAKKSGDHKAARHRQDNIAKTNTHKRSTKEIPL